jgi:hypothetical protein
MIHSSGKLTLPFDLLGYCGHAATPVPKSSHNAFNEIALTIEPDLKTHLYKFKGEHK